MPVCDVKVFLKADEPDSGDEGDGFRDQGWVTEHAKAAVTQRISTWGRPKLISRHRDLLVARK
jgi:hypothetical protein